MRYNPPVRLLLLIFLTLAGELAASEATPAYPLWDGHESVADYAKKVNLPPTKTLELGNGIKLELVLIPAGKFVMGTPKPERPKETVRLGQTILAFGGALVLGLLITVAKLTIRKRQQPNFSLRFLLVFIFAWSIVLFGGVRWHKADQAWVDYQYAQARYDSAERIEIPAHPVMLTQAFYMGKFVVTQAQFRAIVGKNPSKFIGKNNPVETVSWDDAQEFCQKLTKQLDEMVRLPTEAEWEYACRSGTMTMYYSGDTEADLSRVAWYSANSKNTTHSVGQKEPNAFGLYDMLGNVEEWCQDLYGNYPEFFAENPQGPENGNYRILRGGSWQYRSRECRVADRYCNVPHECQFHMGFRVVVSAFKTP